ncbi:MAG: hypothetical protein ABII68_12895 [Pseudomonadota bacterium]
MILCSLLFLQCGPVRVIEDAVSPITDKIIRKDVSELPPEKEYAGEVLAYLIQFILGRAGDPGSREAWATRGLDQQLDFDIISEIMTNPDKNKTGIMVLDPNVMGLTEVLYYYDRKLNLVKDERYHESIYPAPELIAVRLLLLQKIHRGEKIKLKSLLDRKEVLLRPEIEPTEEDLDATHLNADEMMLLKDLFEKEPYLYGYLKSYFLIDAFYRVGAVEGDDFIKDAIRKANYKKYPCRHFGGSYSNDAVKISILPSMTKEFLYGDSSNGLSHYGFKPTEHFNDMTNKLKNEILDATRAIARREIGKGKIELNEKAWAGLWEQIVKEKIAFYVEDEKPLVIYPSNAQQVVRDVCPSADFTVILLDKNVYLSLFIDKEKDIYPHVNRLYMDIMDVKYSMTQDDVDRIGEFIYLKLGSKLEDYLRTSSRHRSL